MSHKKSKPVSKIYAAAASILPAKAVNGLTSSFNKAVSSDLSSSTAAILTNETKSSLRQAVSTVNSMGFQTGVNVAADFTGKMIGGQVKAIVGGGGIPSTSIVQPNDAIQVRNPFLFIYPE